ncbi:hypothetical protein [sulfur-oxidizing endosymbiont of Gigantopelta aegis]|uniref:hypothetical protein n=1 Tax=sulfur-oxidizing endosymbiont of Gigantopelta aegis TaxID=2794934 RepID=UPI0018DC29F9
MKDAAPGIACGVKQVFPDAQQRDDCFHVLYDMNKVRRKIKSHAYHAIENEYSLQKKLATYIENRVTGIAYAAHALDVELAVLTPQYSRIQVSRSCLLLRLLDELKKQKSIRPYQKKYQFFQALFYNLQQALGEKLDEVQSKNTQAGTLQRHFCS